MRVFINDECIGCGMCEATCPDVFSINDDGVAEAMEDFDGDLADAVQDAAESCPVSAIEID